MTKMIALLLLSLSLATAQDPDCMFECISGFRIPKTQLCNGLNECGGDKFEDEDDAKCGCTDSSEDGEQNSWSCDDGSCIEPHSSLCDGYPNCYLDESDEKYCGGCWDCNENTQEVKMGTNGPKEIYEKYDTWKKQMMVDLRFPAPKDGNLVKIVYYAGATKRATDYVPDPQRKLFTGFVERNGYGGCNFNYVTKGPIFMNSPAGKNKKILDGSVKVEKGQHFVFWWENYGVVSYTQMSRNPDMPWQNRFYCSSDTTVPPGGEAPALGQQLENMGYGDVNVDDGWAWRDYAIWWYIDCTSCVDMTLGSDAVSNPALLNIWERHDTYQNYMAVDLRYPFPCDGYVWQIDYWARGETATADYSSDRKLRIAFFTPQNVEGCSFYLYKVYTIDQNKEGFREKKKENGAPMHIVVQADDHFGFFYKNKNAGGVIAFNWLNRNEHSDDGQYYCGTRDNIKNWHEGTEQTLKKEQYNNFDSISHRDYALWVHYCADCPDEPVTTSTTPEPPTTAPEPEF